MTEDTQNLDEIDIVVEPIGEPMLESYDLDADIMDMYGPALDDDIDPLEDILFDEGPLLVFREDSGTGIPLSDNDTDIDIHELF